MNNFSVTYYNRGFKPVGKCIMPLSIANLLDERLDEAQITVYESTIPHFEPNTIFFIHYVENAETDNPTERNFIYKLASDTSVETPNGSGKYKHTISLVELTKTLEGIVGQTVTFTNTLANTYDPKSAIYTISAGALTEDFEGFTLSELVSPMIEGTTIRIAPAKSSEVAEKVRQKMLEISPGIVEHLYGDPDNYVEYSEGSPLNPTRLTGEYNYADVTLHSPLWITYNLVYSWRASSSSASRRWIVRIVSYPIYPVYEGGKAKKYTIKTVCERLFDLAEPRFGRDAKRFFLDPAQRDELDKIIAPEFTMAQSTLREQLKVVGGYIHGEPRITAVADYSQDNRHSYYIGFDYYGKHSVANLGTNPYVRKQYETTLSNYCTAIHTNAVNLVNSLEWARSTVTMPGDGKYSSMRTEQLNVRVDEGNGIFKTQLPIYRPQKLMVGIATPSNVLVAPVDVTKYLFEATDYDSLLSSYSGGYPLSKCYALRYAQGERNITGMFFQAPNILSQALSQYSIVKILALETGQTEQSIQYYLNANVTASLIFQLTYTPIFSTAYTIGKPVFSDKEPFTTVYNQSNGLIESDYYGENVKGVVARLGNVDEVRTYRFNSYADIPKIGDCIGDYYVSAVNIEIDAKSILATVALTKDFNRISQFIGINSEKRIAEISTKQPYERNVVLTEYLYISDTVTDKDDGAIGKGTLDAFKEIFTGGTSFKPITQIAFSRNNTLNASEQPVENLNPIVLPVVACNQGNKVIMTASFKDNFSAGEQVQFINGANGVQGYWQQDVRFCDYYGRAKYMSFEMAHSFTTPQSFAFDLPALDSYPSGTFPIQTRKPYLCRKDSRERLATFAYGIEIVSKNPKINVGSGLAKLSHLCYNGSGSTPIVWLIPYDSEMPYKLDTDVIDYDRSEWDDYAQKYETPLTIGSHANYFGFTMQDTFKPTKHYQGYVVAMPVVSQTETVVDEDGISSTQTTYTGGEILFSKMQDMPAGINTEILNDIYFQVRRR